MFGGGKVGEGGVGRDENEGIECRLILLEGKVENMPGLMVDSVDKNVRTLSGGVLMIVSK